MQILALLLVIILCRGDYESIPRTLQFIPAKKPLDQSSVAANTPGASLPRIRADPPAPQ